MSKCGSATLLIPPRGAAGWAGLGALMSQCGSATLLIPPRGAAGWAGLGALMSPLGAVALPMTACPRFGWLPHPKRHYRQRQRPSRPPLGSGRAAGWACSTRRAWLR